MKEIKVIVDGRNTLRLAEDGKAGDIIRLDSITNVDIGFLNDLINKEREGLLQERIAKAVKDNETVLRAKIERENEEAKKEEDKKHQEELEKLRSQIQKEQNEKDNLKTILEGEKEKALLTLKSEKDLDIQKLQNELSSLKEKQEATIQIEKNAIERNYLDQIQKLRDENQKARSEIEKTRQEAERRYRNGEKAWAGFTDENVRSTMKPTYTPPGTGTLPIINTPPRVPVPANDSIPRIDVAISLQ